MPFSQSLVTRESSIFKPETVSLPCGPPSLLAFLISLPIYLNVSSRNIFITEDFRGKLADIAAPENHARGLVSEKVDIFGFEVVSLELISARENTGGKLVKDSVGFLGGGGGENEGGCFEGLRSFMDPNLKGNYHLAEALCLAILAKTCVANDPLHRPTMDDIMKVHAKMVSPQQPEK